MKTSTNRFSASRSLLLLILLLTASVSAQEIAKTNQAKSLASIDYTQVTFETDEDIYVVGDIHGAYNNTNYSYYAYHFYCNWS